MKHYSMPAVLLLLAAALLLGGLLKSFSRASRAAADLAGEREAAAAARSDLAGIQRAAKAAQARSAAADRFLDAWLPDLASNGNIEQIFGRLDTLAVNNLLSPSGKNFAIKTNYFFNGRQLSVQDVNITVAGDFYRTLNWLGAVESAFPLARVEQISFTNNGSSLSLAAQFVFPRRFDSP
jgi:hypothetical protein